MSTEMIVEPDVAPATAAAPAEPPTRRTSPVLRRLIAKVLPMIAALAGLAAVWYAVTYLVLGDDKRFLLPPPHQVFGETLGRPEIMQPMLAALWQSVMVALAGLVISVVIGMAWAMVMAQTRLLEKVLYPYAVILQTVPILALTPLIGIWMGYGIAAGSCSLSSRCSRVARLRVKRSCAGAVADCRPKRVLAIIGKTAMITQTTIRAAMP